MAARSVAGRVAWSGYGNYNRTMAFAARAQVDWKLRTRSLALGGTTAVMGVLNVTPDSFFDGGDFLSAGRAVERASQMFDEGAAIVDVGGESTRPGEREPVTAAEEMGRVLPVIQGVLRLHPGAILSIDTYKAETARAALDAGAEIVNDVSGFLWDPGMAATCAGCGCGVVLMHTRGRPEEWKRLPRLPDAEVVPLVRRELGARLDAALEAGVERERIVLDPGFGFGKALASNYALLLGLPELLSLGQPLLAAVSRKSFLGRTLAPLHAGTDAPPERRGNASLAAATAAVLAGASVVRAHDVRATLEAVAVADALLASQRASGASLTS